MRAISFLEKLEHKTHHYEPPPDRTPAVILKIRLLHKEIYIVGQKLPKREKLGVHATVEKYCLGLFTEAITAAFSGGQTKITALKTARIYSHIVAHLLRTENELGVLTEKTYLRLSYQTAEIGKMFSGWLTYQTHKEP